MGQVTIFNNTIGSMMINRWKSLQIGNMAISTVVKVEMMRSERYTSNLIEYEWDAYKVKKYHLLPLYPIDYVVLYDI